MSLSMYNKKNPTGGMGGKKLTLGSLLFFVPAVMVHNALKWKFVKMLLLFYAVEVYKM